MLNFVSTLLVLGVVALAMLLTGQTVAGSWNKVVLALAGPDAPVARRVHAATRLRSGPRARAVVVSQQRAWAAVS